MTKIMERFNKMMFASLGIYALDIIVGILFLMFNSVQDRVCCVVLGALILVHGLFFLIRYVYDGLGRKIFASDVIFGVAASIFGLFMIFVPAELLTHYLLLYGIGLCIIGLEVMYYGIIFMKKREETYPLVTSTALLIIIMGILAILNPFKQFMLTLRLVSYFSIATGLFGCSCSNLFKRRARAILDMYK
jgi:uncharacterized membrane protein HdeD (DUF308 family)